MALLSSKTIRSKFTVAEKTNERPYQVGRKVWDKDGYLQYGEGDFVGEDEAIRLGLIAAPEETTSEDATDNVPNDVPNVSDTRNAWDNYAVSVGVDPGKYGNKNDLIEAVYEKLNEESQDELEEESH
ncbi:hypothetical protein [Neptunomonas sp.]|uniref:hypothetical protein n=1 Tax=Neptunomonas sp. TaxID=1971898 RepID=UPI00356A4E13